MDVLKTGVVCPQCSTTSHGVSGMQQQTVQCVTIQDYRYREFIRNFVLRHQVTVICKDDPRLRSTGYAMAEIHNALEWAVSKGVAERKETRSYQIRMARIDRFWKEPKVIDVVPPSVASRTLPLSRKEAKHAARREEYWAEEKEKEEKRNLVFGAVSEYFCVSREELCGRSARREIAYQRSILIYLLHEHTAESQFWIGMYVGRRSQPTVSVTVERIKWNLLPKDPEVQRHVREIRQKFCM